MPIEYEAKLKAGGFLVPTKIVEENNRLFFHFPYNKALLADVKMMEGRKYHGYDEHDPQKVWSVPITQRNLFQLQRMLGNNPYKRYDDPLPAVTSSRPLRDYQLDMKSHGLFRHYCIVAGDMGLGKTLSISEVMEASGAQDWVYVAPRSALESVYLEIEKWNIKAKPRFYTYEGMKALVESWDGSKAPQGIIFDECSRLKNMTAQRTQAAKHMADSIRKEWGDNGYVILMSGTPAPKSPADWWALCEIACPGFLKEGDIHKFRESLGIIVQKETAPGAGSYPHLVTWRDDERKCNVCGEFEDHINHDKDAAIFGANDAHVFVKSVNEVHRLSKRLQGLVMIKRKKDCLSLPDKQYKLLKVKPTQSMLNAAKIIKKRAVSTISALTLLRELSDGFQYEDYEFGTQTCPLCKGHRITKEFYDPTDPLNTELQARDGLVEHEVPCYHCGATGEVAKFAREAKSVGSPKDQIVKDLLDQHSDIGRFVIYAGFSGSVDRVVQICKEEKWNVIRADGRGWISDIVGCERPRDMLKMFQSEHDSNIVFVGQADAAGMGLTLTASPGILYFSNSFNGEARIQSEDRIHRLGMDENRGATIYDIEHLPTDTLVLNNLKGKRRLQDMSLGELDVLDAPRDI
jgi:SNF2 family DNA or RNA helicase